MANSASEERVVINGIPQGLTCINGIPADRLAGLVCTGGSLLSRAVIVARAVGIPAVTGAPGLIPSQRAGREVIVEFQHFHQQASRLRKELDELRDLPTKMPDGRHIALQANITQLRALLPANAGLGNLRLLLPMLTLTSELQEARVLIERARAGLEEDGQPASLPPVGIMVEVPAAVFRIDELAAGADFVSIGTNDLTQYLLATDRGNPYVGEMCDPLTPAVLDAIGLVAEGARRRGIAISVGGELAGDPSGALLLLGLGVDALSMTPGSIGRVKQVIRTFSTREAGNLWRDALKADSADRVRELLEQSLEEKGIGSLVGPGR